MGRLADAELLYRSILERGFNKAATVGLAGVLRDQGLQEKAGALDEAVLRVSPDDDYAYHGLRAIEADRRTPLWQRKSYLNWAAATKRLSQGGSTSPKPVHRIEAYFDGLCEPNPGGYARGGWCVAAHSELPWLAGGLEGYAFYHHGVGATNNMAEYRAALDALRAIYRCGYRGQVLLHGDSQVVVNQFTGKWECHQPELQELRDRLRYAATFFERLNVVWVPREQNACADKQSRLAYRLAYKGAVREADGLRNAGAESQKKC